MKALALMFLLRDGVSQCSHVCQLKCHNLLRGLLRLLGHALFDVVHDDDALLVEKKFQLCTY